jgi:lipoate---protein ligase
MHSLDLTLPDAAENLALDEALLEEAEEADAPLETLRLWEFPVATVVVGRSSQVEAEVHVDVCRQLGIPILRRASGGAAVVAGPGCLMYSLVLSYQDRPALRVLGEAHRDVLGTLAAALAPLVAGVKREGTSDLAINPRVEGDRPIFPVGKGTVPFSSDENWDSPRMKTGTGTAADRGSASATAQPIAEPVPVFKFSGNSVRCRRNHFLYHGTLLYDFPLALIERCLRMPPRVPEYRAGRAHGAFVTNLPVAAETLRRAIKTAWNAVAPRDDWPREQTAELVRVKYGRPEWNGL